MGPVYDGALVTLDELTVDAEVVRDAGAEAGPDVAVEETDDPEPDAEPEAEPDPDDPGPEDASVPELSKAARLAETSELIDAISALSRFAEKKSGSPSVCNGGKEKETDELEDEAEDELEPDAEVAEELADEPEADVADELESEVAVDESSFEEDLFSSSFSSSCDNC